MQTSGPPCREGLVVPRFYAGGIHERFRSGDLEMAGLMKRLPVGCVSLIINSAVNKCCAKMIWGGR